MTGPDDVRPAGPAAYRLERAWVGGRVHDDVLVEVVDGRFTRVEPAGVPGPGTTPEHVPGLTLPGLANCHSHAFHRALRGRTQRSRGTFWTWREQMYAAAARLTPDSYRALAVEVYREMLAAGVTTVGEFHYLHHGPDGARYADPHAMELALVDAAAEAGIRLALLDTCYVSSGFGEPPEGVQRRFSDGDADAWAARHVDLVAAVGATARHAGPTSAPAPVVGAAVHSVRAVPAEQLGTVALAARGAPLHVHLSEQVLENERCLAVHGTTPTALLDAHGVLGPLTSAVHATHLSDDDVARLGRSGTWACFCPTTERDLGDGIGPSRALHRAGSALSLGSDSHAVVDLFEEMRAVELDERLATRERGHWAAAELIAAATAHASLGVPDAGRTEVGARADLVTLDTLSLRTAGTGADEHTAVFAAGAADVVRTMVAGRVVHRREHGPAVARRLDRLVRDLLD